MEQDIFPPVDVHVDNVYKKTFYSTQEFGDYIAQKSYRCAEAEYIMALNREKKSAYLKGQMTGIIILITMQLLGMLVFSYIYKSQSNKPPVNEEVKKGSSSAILPQVYHL